jgi:predicted DNA binding CopG/RHH family protein
MSSSEDRNDASIKTSVRSVRFEDEQIEAITKKAAELGMKFSPFVRIAALKAAGVGKEEIARVRRLANSLEKL